jgi:hypothetical protein
MVETRRSCAASWVLGLCLTVQLRAHLVQGQLSSPIASNSHVSIDGNKFLQREADRHDTSWRCVFIATVCGAMAHTDARGNAELHCTS